MNLNARSLRNLADVHPALVAVVELAASRTVLDFIVTEGLRTPERQAQLLKAGATLTLKSRHLTGHAVDLAAVVGGSVRWDWPLYSTLASEMKAAAKDLGTPLEWGGDWTTFKDGPHFQLPFTEYPA